MVCEAPLLTNPQTLVIHVQLTDITFMLSCLTIHFVALSIVYLRDLLFSSTPAKNQSETSSLRAEQLLPSNWKLANWQRE